VVSHAGCAAIIAATTMLARSFAIRTVAEGVETREQYDALRAAGVELIQGYYFARPAPCSAWRVVDGRIVLPGDAGATARAA
jgi:EAL domain-containing protein (putative c-di-GMP-specific phosphodiesterase class I)